MVSRRANFGERSMPAPDMGSELQSAGGGGGAGAAQSNVLPLMFTRYFQIIFSISSIQALS